jgi:cytochrome P450
MIQKADHGLPVIETNNDAFYLDPNGPFAAYSERPPLAKSEYGTEVLSYHLVRDSFYDKRMTPRTVEYFEKLGASELIVEFIREGNLNFMAPDKHDRIRAIVSKAFTRPRVEGFRPEMRRIANELVDAFIDRGQCDLVADVCHMYPVSVFAQFLGVPASDVPLFSDATVQLRMLGQVPFAPGMPALERALTFLYDYITGLVARRRAEPDDDFVGALIALQAAGEKLSETELIWGLVFLMLAGHDTTRFTLASCFHSLIAAGLWDDMAREPLRAPEAIAESMRICPGTPRQMRLVAESFELAGHHFDRGEVVSLNLNAAGRDRAVFEAADEFRCGRDDPAYLVGFGMGRHVCLGQLLAKVEMEEAVAAVTARLAEVEIAGPCRLKPTGVIAGYDSVPVRFVARAGRAV